MYQKGHKIITIVMLLAFLNACTKTITYVSPKEQDKILTAKTVILTLDDGSELELHILNIDDNRIIGLTREKEEKEIDLASIRSVRIEKTNAGTAILFGTAAVVTAWIVIGIATAPEPPPTECCPFIYSFNGEAYVFDAEPYGAAVSKGLKRAEWCELEHIRGVEGEYRLLISNELDEIQYTDELRLLVVDHASGSFVAPDINGGIHTIVDPIPPIQAYSQRGGNIYTSVFEKDGHLWESQIEGRNPEKIKDAKDELIFEFPKPEGANTAKFLVNACTSFWGARMGRTFLSLYGNKLNAWYDELDRMGPAYFRTLNWYMNEGLYTLKIWVQTRKGWEVKGAMLGGGPFVSKDKVYVLDVSDVPGNILRIKLTPAVNFWKIDYLGVDYSQDLQVVVSEVSSVEAFDNKGQDIKVALASTDNQFYVMPQIGDFAEVRFREPPHLAGWERTVILKASGYYKIPLDTSQVEPQWEIIERLHTEPGFTAQFVLREYLRWKNENASQRNK